MTLTLANRKDAIKHRLIEAFGPPVTFVLGTRRPRKGAPRQITVMWSVYPFEDTVRTVLGDLCTDDVLLVRNLMWSCGHFHTDSRDAWESHEGEHHLVDNYDGCCGYDLPNRVLPEDVEEELRAAGETFESACVPGNHVHCLTCGGTARIMPDRRALRFEPCPDCVRLGTDRGQFPGILNLDNPDHLAFFEARLNQIRDEINTKTAREQAKREKAKTVPTTYASPQWLPLPTRDAGILNGLPVAPVVGCDYLTHPEDPDRRVLCSNQARWFDPTTGLRVCTRHTDQTGRLP